MLIQFNFNNYKSFKNEGIIDLSATKSTEYEDHIIEYGDEKLLPVAAIYGANASGKSVIYSAFRYMRRHVLNSFKIDPKNDRNAALYQQIPYLFNSKSRKADSTFEVFFIIPYKSTYRTYKYGFSINKLNIKEEWLYYKSRTSREFKLIFHREGEEFDLSGLPSNCHENIKTALDKHVLIVSLGAMLKVEECAIIRNWFANNIVMDFADMVQSAILQTTIPNGFDNNQEVQEDVIKYLSSFDNGIKHFKINKLETQEDEEKYTIDTFHKTEDDDGYVSIPINFESAGTLKMFSLYQSLKDIMKKGGVLFIDELNARLHPLLVRNIIYEFTNPNTNKNHAQLIFTTHDVWQLENQLLRKDEIWFAEKDENGVSSTYSLADFKDEAGNKIRKDENYLKNYLLGKYGAIPSLSKLDMLNQSKKD